MHRMQLSNCGSPYRSSHHLRSDTCCSLPTPAPSSSSRPRGLTSTASATRSVPHKQSLSDRRQLLSDRLSNRASTRLRAESQDRSEPEQPVQYATEFGYNRKDVIAIGVGLLVLGYAAYYGLQAAGIEAGQAGNFVQLGVFVILSFGWTASYLLRVVNKDMTYSKQLKQYEEAVMQKRLEEMPETERSRLYEEVEAEKARSKR